jgi:hypothetical protein
MLAAGKARNEESPAEIPLADRRHRFAVAPARWSLLSQKKIAAFGEPTSSPWLRPVACCPLITTALTSHPIPTP